MNFNQSAVIFFQIILTYICTYVGTYVYGGVAEYYIILYVGFVSVFAMAHSRGMQLICVIMAVLGIVSIQCHEILYYSLQYCHCCIVLMY